MTLNRPILVSIAHRDSLVRSCLVAALGRTPDIVVNLAAAGAHELDEFMQQHALSRVIIADYDSGVVLANRAPRNASAPPVIIVSGADREWEIRHALAHRVRGYLVPGFEMEHLDEGVRAVQRGSRYLCPQAAARLAESLSFEALTEREAQVLALVVRGEPNKTIGRQLDISIGTVKSHIKSTYGKLGVTSRTQAIAVADRRGLLRRPTSVDSMPQQSVSSRHFSTLATSARLSATVGVAFG